MGRLFVRGCAVVVAAAFVLSLPGPPQSGSESESPAVASLLGQIRSAANSESFLDADDATGGASDELRGNAKVRVSHTSKAAGPIVHLEMRDAAAEPISFCSGTLIGPNVILTAAHCLAWGPVLRDILVTPAKGGTQSPHGVQLAARWIYSSGFLSATTFEQAIANDYGLVVLPDTTLTDKTGSLSVAAVPDAELQMQGPRFAAVGYPFECDQTKCGLDDDISLEEALPGQGAYPWLAPLSHLNPVGATLRNDSDVAGGMSGGPLLRLSDLAVSGLTSMGSPLWTNSTRITPAIVSQLQAWCLTGACTINVAPTPPTGAPRMHRLFVAAMAGDSTMPMCGGERTFLRAFGDKAVEWSAATEPLLNLLSTVDTDFEVPAWRQEFAIRLDDFDEATDAFLAVGSPPVGFAEYVASARSGVTGYSSAMHSLLAAFDSNDIDELEEVLDAFFEARSHLRAAAGNYPGLNPDCLAPLGNPFPG
jgi:V8-like Glu-specific endopeptidase